MTEVLRSFLQRCFHAGRSPEAIPSNDQLFIKDGYRPRLDNDYFEDRVPDGDEGVIHQPDVYPLAAILARRFDCTHIIDIGCGRAGKLVELHPEFQICGIDYGANIRYCRKHYRFGKWLRWDLNAAKLAKFNRALLKKSLIICSDVIEHLANPLHVLTTLEDWLRDAPIAILTTPERELVRGSSDLGPPANPSHVREWNLGELQRLLDSVGMHPLFHGLTVNNSRDLAKKTSLVLLGNSATVEIVRAPANFRVVAMMTAYNEVDIIVPALSQLISQGVEVYLIDNWSTDGTAEKARPLLGHGLIGIEKYPPEGAPQYYEWERLLRRVESLAGEITADWFIHHDVDEIRESPWPGVGLKDALFRVDRSGFNAVDHTVVNFPPVDEGFVCGTSFKDYFTYFEFGKQPGHFNQIKAWKNLGLPINLTESGGHGVVFEGRRLYPFNFLLRHYPIRSQIHGETKVYAERIPRFSADEKAKGWHMQYDAISDRQCFLKLQSELQEFDAATFCQNFLVERLSRVGVLRSK